MELPKGGILASTPLAKTSAHMVVKKTKKPRRAPRSPSDGGLLQRTMALQHLLETLFANEFANMTQEHATQLAGRIVNDYPMGFDKESAQLVQLMLARALAKAEKARPPPGSESQRQH